MRNPLSTDWGRGFESRDLWILCAVMSHLPRFFFCASYIEMNLNVFNICVHTLSRCEGRNADNQTRAQHSLSNEHKELVHKGSWHEIWTELAKARVSVLFSGYILERLPAWSRHCCQTFKDLPPCQAKGIKGFEREQSIYVKVSWRCVCNFGETSTVGLFFLDIFN
jgi:hypothetical protein